MWKTFAGHRIYQAPTRETVHQNFFYRWLTFDSNVLQTLISRRNPKQPGLRYINELTVAIRAQPADCCLLGLGGAGVAHALGPYLHQSTLTAVENNKVIIDIAKLYFMTDHLKQLTIIHQDANVFVQQCKIAYQHLMIDLYCHHSFPKHCNNEAFFAACKTLLRPEGVLALNLANLDEQWSVYQNMKAIFSHSLLWLPVKGTANMVVLACNSPTVTPLLALLKKKQCLKKLTWDPVWGCIAEITEPQP